MATNSNDDEQVRELFREYVPEVASGIVEIKSIARERGLRTMVAVNAPDSDVSAVAVCVGLKGIHIKTIARQLAEKVDVILWSESAEAFLRNALAPANVERIIIESAERRAAVYASPENKSLIKPRQALCSRLVGLTIQVIDP
jgi:N utilization substance protein A